MSSLAVNDISATNNNFAFQILLVEFGLIKLPANWSINKFYP